MPEKSEPKPETKPEPKPAKGPPPEKPERKEYADDRKTVEPRKPWPRK
jgi:hypothetical protein